MTLKIRLVAMMVLILMAVLALQYLLMERDRRELLERLTEVGTGLDESTLAVLEGARQTAGGDGSIDLAAFLNEVSLDGGSEEGSGGRASVHVLVWADTSRQTGSFEFRSRGPREPGDFHEPLDLHGPRFGDPADPRAATDSLELREIESGILRRFFRRNALESGDPVPIRSREMAWVPSGSETTIVRGPLGFSPASAEETAEMDEAREVVVGRLSNLPDGHRAQFWHRSDSTLVQVEIHTRGELDDSASLAACDGGPAYEDGGSSSRDGVRSAMGPRLIRMVSDDATLSDMVINLPMPLFAAESDSFYSVQVRYPLDSITAELDRSRRRGLVWLASVLGVGIVGAILVAGQFTRPIRSLQDSFGKVVEGDLSHRVRPQRDDEIGKLTRSFNEMVARLQESKEVEHRLAEAERLAAVGRLAAGVAHEVRNPLNAILLTMQQLRDRVGRRLEANGLENVDTANLSNQTAATGGSGHADTAADSEDAGVTIDSKSVFPANDSKDAATTNDLESPATAGGSASTAAASSRSGSRSAADFHKYYRLVTAEIARLERLVGAFLDLSKSGEIRLETCELVESLQSSIELFRPEADRSGVRVEVDLPESVRVDGDPSRLPAVWNNLISNALAASPSGGQIRVQGVREGNTIRIRVEDDGPGIPERDITKIWDPFFSGRQDGTGLGLSIVRSVVERHGGRVEAGNHEGGGARFEVVLPLGQMGASDETERSPSTRA